MRFAMQIKSLFKKDIFRTINGVVKAHQLDERSVWQELDEFVLTRELDRHFRKFLSAYLNVMTIPMIRPSLGKWGCGYRDFSVLESPIFLKCFPTCWAT